MCTRRGCLPPDLEALFESLAAGGLEGGGVGVEEEEAATGEPVDASSVGDAGGGGQDDGAASAGESVAGGRGQHEEGVRAAR